MSALMPYLIAAALAVVSAALLLGLWNMARGGSSHRSQKLMRWRIALQFLCVIVIMTALYFTVQP